MCLVQRREAKPVQAAEQKQSRIYSVVRFLEGKTTNVPVWDALQAGGSAACLLRVGFRMLSILCLVGVCWFALAALFVVALGVAAKRPMPVEEPESAVVLEQAA